jgi:hypothetical protein
VQPGSTDEALAHIALQRRHNIHFLTTLTLVNAIIHVGNTIAAAVSGSGSSSSGGDAFKNSIQELKKLLFPDEEAKLEKRASEVREILEREAASGPFQVRAVDGGKQKGRVRLRRK